METVKFRETRIIRYLLQAEPNRQGSWVLKEHPQNSKFMELYFSRSLLLTEPTITDKLKGITESLESVDLDKKNLTDEDEILYGRKTHERVYLT